jgi:hypothetical protein
VREALKKQKNLKTLYMKTQNTNLFNALSKSSLQELVQSVSETVAVNVETVPVKTFSAADLWRIQNSRRVRTIRRLVA